MENVIIYNYIKIASEKVDVDNDNVDLHKNEILFKVYGCVFNRPPCRDTDDEYEYLSSESDLEGNLREIKNFRSYCLGKIIKGKEKEA